jgi:hypothetical protein
MNSRRTEQQAKLFDGFMRTPKMYGAVAMPRPGKMEPDKAAASAFRRHREGSRTGRPDPSASVKPLRIRG